MSSLLFNNVTGFKLKHPNYSSLRNQVTQYGEWIEIIKKKNELPIAKLRTWVLYYRNNGDDTESLNSDDNYRFYNPLEDCPQEKSQLGSIWGFPLLNVDGSNNWTAFNSGIGDGSGNDLMLYNLENRDILVLDFSGYNESFNDISNNIPGYNDTFFLILRIKSSTENLLNKHYNLYNGDTVEPKKWASLVEYIYECDIIGPSPILDFSLDFFSFIQNRSGIQYGKLFGSTTNFNGNTYNLAYCTNANSYKEELNIKILTGLGITSKELEVMSTDSIVNTLSLPNKIDSKFWFKYLQVIENYNSTDNPIIRIVKLVGGFNDIQYNNVTNVYANLEKSGSSYPFNKSDIDIDEMWKYNLSITIDSTQNNWTNNEYRLETLLWCSLLSSRKISTRKMGVHGNYKRFITNFLDLKGTNECVGGGFGRDIGTIDIARKTYLPYYSRQGDNNNTIRLEEYTPSRDNFYLDASGVNTILTTTNNGQLEPEIGNILSAYRTINDLESYFKIYFKPLIPLVENNYLKIKYTFGETHNSNVTFFRYNGMDGSADPVGISSINAKREEESITLRWDKNDIQMKSIILFDIASGFSLYESDLSDISSNIYKHIINSNKYDISCNVVQFKFFANKLGIPDINTGFLPYSSMGLNTVAEEAQIIDISYVPINYKPYRYINYISYKNVNVENIFFTENIKYPLKETTEQLLYSANKIFPSLTKPNVLLISPKDNISINPVSISVNSEENITPQYEIFSEAKNLTEEEVADAYQSDIFILTENTGNMTISNTNREIIEGNIDRYYYLPPNSMEFNNYFIPDYWSIPKQINNLVNTGSNKYNLFKFNWLEQIKVTNILEILSVLLRNEVNGIPANNIDYLLINSNQLSNDFTSVTESGSIANGKIVFDVVGADLLPSGQTLDVKPIIVQLETVASGPFGQASINYIGNINGALPQGIPGDGINKPNPQDPSTYEATELIKSLKQGNGPNNINLGKNSKAYNGLYTIRVSCFENSLAAVQNPSFNGTTIFPENLKVLLVDISSAVQTNKGLDMISNRNDMITIKWSGFYFSRDTSWNSIVGQSGNIKWTVSRYNLATGVSTVIHNDIVSFINNEYVFRDTNVRVYDKYRYTVNGKYEWFGIRDIISNSEIPTLNVPGFTTEDIFVCKFNRFPYGRFNTTSTNLKLYAPLLMSTTGQVDQYGRNAGGGPCSDPSNPNLKLFTRTTRISSSNNIYSNTTNQVTKKQTYVTLSKSRFRPTR